MFMMRFFSKRVRIPAFNVKQRQQYIQPEKEFLNPAEYNQLTNSYIRKMHSALTELQRDNSTSVLLYIDEGLKFEINDFRLELQKDPKTQEMTLMVGDGISHNYTYDRGNERWVSLRDGHLLDELISREVSLRCKGFFNI